MGRDENEKHFKVIFNVRIELGTVVCGCYFGPFLAWLAMVCMAASTKNNDETVWRVRVLKGPLNRLGGFQDSGFGLEEGFGGVPVWVPGCKRGSRSHLRN